jgi:hypothetical protein
MRADTQYHGIKGIELDAIRSHTMDSGKVFYARCLVITMDDGTKESISLFSDDGYSMLVIDPDVEEMTEPELKVA